MGGICSYGYKLVRLGRVNKKGHELFNLAINEEEAAVVVFIYKSEYCGTRLSLVTNGKTSPSRWDGHGENLVHLPDKMASGMHKRDMNHSKFGFYFFGKYSMMYLYSMEFVLNELLKYLQLFIGR